MVFDGGKYQAIKRTLKTPPIPHYFEVLRAAPSSLWGLDILEPFKDVLDLLDVPLSDVDRLVFSQINVEASSASKRSSRAGCIPGRKHLQSDVGVTTQVSIPQREEPILTH